jgi:hypothetical protein
MGNSLSKEYEQMLKAIWDSVYVSILAGESGKYDWRRLVQDFLVELGKRGYTIISISAILE